MGLAEPFSDILTLIVPFHKKKKCNLPIPFDFLHLFKDHDS